MKTLLRLDASARTQASHSRGLGDYFLQQWQQRYPQGKIIQRDLADNPVPHLSNTVIEAFHLAGNRPSRETALSDSLIHELKTADELLICSPLYNFTLPSTLKAYLDHVVRSGLTFDMQQGQHSGLLYGTSAIIITARGSLSSTTATDDFQTDYLTKILNFMGIAPIETITVEGTALEAVEQQIDHYFNPAPASLWKGLFTEEEKQAINKLRQQQTSAIVNGDAAAYAELCQDNIQLMIPGHDIVSGRKQFLITEQKLFSSTSFIAFRKYPQQIQRAGDRVIEIGRQEITTDRTDVNGGVPLKAGAMLR